MKLENVAHYLSPKSSRLDSIAIFSHHGNVKREDVIAALSYADQQCNLGIELYLAKINISSPDKSLESLLNLATLHKNEYAIFQEIEPNVLNSILRVICAFVYQDYARSAESERPCKKCNSSGFIDAKVFTNTRRLAAENESNKPMAKLRVASRGSSDYYNFKNAERVICKTCNGKGKLRHACQCRGRGHVLDKEQTYFRQVPVLKECEKCKGRGYSRVRFSTVLKGIQAVYPLKKTVAYQQIKPFFEMMVAKCYQAEAQADSAFSKVMKSG